MKEIFVWKVSACFCALLSFTQVYADSFAVKIKENVKDNWEEVSEWCEEVVNLENGMSSLPENSWIPWKRDREKQRADIREIQQRIKEMLLSVDSPKFLKKIEKLDAKIVEVKKKIENIREESAFRPEKKRKE